MTISQQTLNMSITTEFELIGMQKASEAVAYTLKEMTKFAQIGMTTKELDEFGAKNFLILEQIQHQSLLITFPSYNCISINNEFCHGIPLDKRVLEEGDLINIDVSAELNGFWADNGCSFVLGEDIHKHHDLVNASKILKKAIDNIKGGVRISDIGYLMESEAKMGYKVITTWRTRNRQKFVMKSLMTYLITKTDMTKDGLKKFCSCYRNIYIYNIYVC